MRWKSTVSYICWEDLNMQQDTGRERALNNAKASTIQRCVEWKGRKGVKSCLGTFIPSLSTAKVYQARWLSYSPFFIVINCFCLYLTARAQIEMRLPNNCVRLWMCCQTSLHAAERFQHSPHPLPPLFLYSYCMWDQPGFVFSLAIGLFCFPVVTNSSQNVFVVLFWSYQLYLWLYLPHLTQLPVNSGNPTAAWGWENLAPYHPFY